MQTPHVPDEREQAQLDAAEKACRYWLGDSVFKHDVGGCTAGCATNDDPNQCAMGALLQLNQIAAARRVEQHQHIALIGVISLFLVMGFLVLFTLKRRQ